MSQIQQNDTVKLLSGFETLLSSNVNLKNMVQILKTSRNKLNEKQDYQKLINQFLNCWQQTVEKNVHADDFKNNLEGEKDLQQTSQPQSTSKRINEQQQLECQKKSTLSISSCVDLKDEILRVQQKLKEKRCPKLAKLFNQQLIRNSQNCQLFIHLINISKSLKFKLKKITNKFCMCLHCNFFERTQYKSTNAVSDGMKNHFQTCHPRICCQAYKNIGTYQLSDAYKKLLDRNERQGNEYYKCNCQIKPCKDSQQYINHVQNIHDNVIPPYCSHIYNQSNDLIINPNFNQSCVIQDIVNHESYYCAQCDIAFERRPEVFYHHLINYHHGKTNHPGTSHYLKSDHHIMQSSTSNILQLRSQLIAKHKPIVSTEKKKLGRPPKIKTGQFQSKEKVGFAETLRQRMPQFEFKLKTKPAFHGLVKITLKYKSQTKPFPEEQKIRQIIENYKGPFICNVCNKDFLDYRSIAEHFDSTSVFNSHLRKQKNWMRVRIKKMNENQQYYYFLPITEEFKDIQFIVPCVSEQTISYYKMGYTQFIAYALDINKNYSSYMWFHYSEFFPSNKKDIQNDEERHEESYEEKHEEKNSFQFYEQNDGINFEQYENEWEM